MRNLAVKKAPLGSRSCTVEGGNQPPAFDQESNAHLPELRAEEDRDTAVNICVPNRVARRRRLPPVPPAGNRPSTKSSSATDAAAEYGRPSRPKSPAPRPSRDFSSRPSQALGQHHVQIRGRAPLRTSPGADQEKPAGRPRSLSINAARTSLPEPCLSWGEEHDRKLAAMKETAPGGDPPFSVRLSRGRT